MLRKGAHITTLLNKIDYKQIESKEIEMKDNFDKRKLFTGTAHKFDSTLPDDQLTP